MEININEVIKALKTGKHSTEDSQKLASILENKGIVYVEYEVLTSDCYDGFVGDTIRKFVGKNVLGELLRLSDIGAIKITKIDIRK